MRNKYSAGQLGLMMANYIELPEEADNFIKYAVYIEKFINLDEEGLEEKELTAKVISSLPEAFPEVSKDDKVFDERMVSLTSKIFFHLIK